MGAKLAEQASYTLTKHGELTNEVYMVSQEAKRIADALGVSLDYLVGKGINAHFDKKTLQGIQDI